MLSKRAIQHTKWRLFTFQLCGGTFLTWDRKSDKICRPNPYLFFMAAASFSGGILFAFAHALQIYLKLNPNDIPEEAGSPPDPDEERNEMYAFATMVIGWGELGVGVTLFGISVVAFRENDNIIWLYNAIFAYNQTILDFMAERNIQLDRNHKKAQRTAEELILATSVGSTAVAFLMLLSCLHPLEPTHVILKEWLEIEWEWRLVLLPWLFLFNCAIQGCAIMILTFGLMVECYCYLVIPILEDLRIERIHHRQGSRCTLATRYFGNLEDIEICNLYRTQRYLNVRVNEVMGTVWISFHQVGLLLDLSIMLFFFVKFQNVIWEVGPIACAVVVGAIAVPLAICYYQSNFFGELVDRSDEFKIRGIKRLPRRTMYRKFAYSCQTYFVEEAYPFFHYHRNTFLEFCAAGLDYAINLMLW